MKEELEFSIQRGILDNRKRKLILNKSYIQFESNDLKSNLYTIFKKDEIAEFRYGMKWITFSATIGREYFIYIKNKQAKIIKISFATYFGRKKTEFHKIYSEIISSLNHFYFDEIAENLIKKHEENENIKIGEVLILNDSIVIKTSGIMHVSEKSIALENVQTKDFITYFSIYSFENPSNINRGYSYLNDWNTSVLYTVLRTILSKKGIEKYK